MITIWHAKHEAGLLRMQQACIIPIDHSSTMIEILADNADPSVADVHAAFDMPFSVLVGQISPALTKK